MTRLNTALKVAGDPRWWRFYAQRRFKKYETRERFASMVASLNPKWPAPEAASKAKAAELAGRGLLPLGKALAADQCRDLVSYFETKTVHDPYRPSVPPFPPLSDEKPPEAHIAHHFPRDIVSAPYLLDIANRQDILEIVAAFLGCKPTIGYMATWWSYPTELGAQQAENFHRDVDDFRFVKLFMYLTDVGEENGPHKYVLHSAQSNALSQIRRFEDDEVADVFGGQNIVTMTAKAGEMFLENTYGIHKGQPVKDGRRLLFQVVYSQVPLPYSPTKAVLTLGDRPYNPWINRLYLKT